MSWIDRERKTILIGLLILFVAGAILLVTRRPPTGSVQVVLPPPTDTPAPTATPGPMRVYICGAINHPDVYELPAGSIIKDAITAAGGATDDADLNRINLAQELQDQMQVYVPYQEEGATAGEVVPTPGTTAKRNISEKININAASLEELQSLPGVGPVLAQRIVDYRPYEELEDILDVPGIGEATLEKLRPRISVR